MKLLMLLKKYWLIILLLIATICFTVSTIIDYSLDTLFLTILCFTVSFILIIVNIVSDYSLSKVYCIATSKTFFING